MFSRFYTIAACDRQTDTHTHTHNNNNNNNNDDDDDDDDDDIASRGTLHGTSYNQRVYTNFEVSVFT